MEPGHLKRLMKFDEKIQEIALEFGLDFFLQEFDIVPARKMLEIIAYRLPVNYSHWSFGRDFELEKTKYEHGFGIPYEVVLNTDPSRAFLMNTNPLPVQVLVMAHVYAHNDFMKNNIYFAPTRRDILPAASEAAQRFRNYEKEYGVEPVERVIDAALGIELNIDPDLFTVEENDDEAGEKPRPADRPQIRPGPFDDLIGTHLHPSPEGHAAKNPPPKPDRDLMMYIIQHSPKPLAKWEQDVLSVVRGQSLYFMPQRRTKIMNEGWATFWHMKIMDRLFQEGWLNQEEHGFYNLYNARVLAENPRSLNPYLVGFKLYCDIESRWNTGRYGREWEGRRGPAVEQNPDSDHRAGRDKIFEVRRSYSDRFFIEQFLTEDLAEDLLLYLYRGQQKVGKVEYAIADRDWKRIKTMLVHRLSTFETPLIFVQDGDFKGRRELFLQHAYEETELDREYREKTLEHLFYLWARPVHLETIVNNEKVVFTYDGTRHHTASSL